MTHKLFEPFDLKSLAMKNRVVMAPMTRCRAGEGDVPTALMAEYYAQRATAGLIISEGVPVNDRARGYLWTPGVYSREQVAGWRTVCDAVHAAGGRMFMQIWHVGRVSHSSLQPDMASPQGPTAEQAGDAVCFAYDESGNATNVPVSPPEALDAGAIAEVEDAFVQAARNAIDAGMDGVEIHGANGYLFDQFLSSQVNNRVDEYGGSAANRCRLLLETVDRVSDAIGASRTGVRISPNGRFNAMPEDPELVPTFAMLARELDRRGVAYLHINDQATFGLPAIPDGLVASIREAFSGPIILCGGYDATRAQQALDEGVADLVAFGAPYIANPDLVARLENGWPLGEPDQATFYGGGEQGYIDYPRYAE